MKTIIEMAREYAVGGLEFDAEGLERFVNDVRADEREENAKVCEKVAVDVFTQLGREHEPYMKATAEDCAMHIRARGQPKRKWVGLTHEEHMEIMTGTMTTSSRMAAVEAKLKEKNT